MTKTRKRRPYSAIRNLIPGIHYSRDTYSYAKGPYASFRDFTSGISQAIGKGATWNDVSRYESEFETSIKYGYHLKIGTFTSPLTTKGDLLTYSTIAVRKAVGNFEQSFIADSVESTGNRWNNKYWFPNPYRRWSVQTAPNQTGISAPSVDGAPLGLMVNDSGSATSRETDGSYIPYTATTTLADSAGIFPSESTIQRRWGIIEWWVIKTGALSTDIENARIWIGSGSAALSGSDEPVLHYMAFRYSTSIDSTAFWACVTDGATGTPETTTTTVAITADTRYLMRIDASATDNVRFYINDVLVATHTTNLPTSSTNQRPAFSITNLSAGTTRAIKFSRFFFVYD